MVLNAFFGPYLRQISILLAQSLHAVEDKASDFVLLLAGSQISRRFHTGDQLRPHVASLPRQSERNDWQAFLFLQVRQKPAPDRFFLSWSKPSLRWTFGRIFQLSSRLLVAVSKHNE